MKLQEAEFAGVKCYYRPGINEQGSDFDSLQEVLRDSGYSTPGFDVLPGEKWLDLGANIGAFALYCKSKGAIAVCFEPDFDSFSILQHNVPDFECHNCAVTNREEDVLRFFGSKNPDNYWRGTVIPTEKYQEQGNVLNQYAGVFVGQEFDGVKMDIEGSEGPLLDEWLLPKCQKLCLEYHTSRDQSVPHLRERIAKIRSKFKQVVVPSDYSTVIRLGYATYAGTFDSLIFAWEPR